MFYFILFFYNKSQEIFGKARKIFILFRIKEQTRHFTIRNIFLFQDVDDWQPFLKEQTWRKSSSRIQILLEYLQYSPIILCEKYVNLELIAIDRKYSHCFRLRKVSLVTSKISKSPGRKLLKNGIFREERCDVTLPWKQNFWITTIGKTKTHFSPAVARLRHETS